MVNYCPTCGNELQYKEAEICPNCGVRIRNPSSSESGKHAGFWIRFVAAFIDGLILLIPLLIINIGVAALTVGSLFVQTYNQSYNPGAFVGYYLGMFLVGVIVQWLYFALQESSTYQATLGKRAVGLIVINENSNQISLGQATIRYLIKAIPILNLISYIVLAIDEKKQGLHDKAAGTFVIYK